MPITNAAAAAAAKSGSICLLTGTSSLLMNNKGFNSDFILPSLIRGAAHRRSL